MNSLSSNHFLRAVNKIMKLQLDSHDPNSILKHIFA